METTVHAFKKDWRIVRKPNGWFLYREKGLGVKIAGKRMLEDDVKKIAKSWLSNNGKKNGWI